MTSTPTQPDSGRAATGDPSSAQRLSEWRTRLDAFATTFDEEISQILKSLSTITFDEPARPVPSNSGCGKTMEFALPPAPPVTPPATPSLPVTPAASANVAVVETDRLAALKAKLSQQMASAGQSHNTTVRTAERG